ncbi:MAG TPA: RNA 2',3'-cyclic phosphodiesterase [Acidobacteriota bacterium]|nr:RNA 2',3'-cyclic phosphodiesterase [Acidobacteriota bacterium]
MRAFIAIDLDPGLKAAVQDLIRALEATRAEVRWTKPGGYHLTLKFLGEIDEATVERVKAVLKAAASRRGAFSLRLRGTGAFPGELNPRVLWLGIEAGPELAGLQSDLEAALETEGFPREDRPFKPHLTLGRVKGRGRLDKAMAELAKHAADDLGGMTARKVALFESLLRPDGAEYHIVDEAGLG